MNNDDINDYRRVIHDNLQTIYMDGKMHGSGYLGMSLENLETNILNMLDDCDNDTNRFREAISKVFGRPYDNPQLPETKEKEHARN